MSIDVSRFVMLAERLADTAGAIARRYFRTPFKVDDKPDTSPVTIADREAELAMRQIIEGECPDHGIIGEEHGTYNGGADFLWVLDPIDGTKSFITGRPLFGALIALCHQGKPIVGVIECPALDERWLGASGRPTVHRSRHAPPASVRTRACGDLKKAALYCTSPLMFDDAALPLFERVRQAVKLPLYGGDCYAYGQLASGYADLVVEAGLQPYDWAALVPIIEGAGGIVTDWRGERLQLTTTSSRVLAAGDLSLHAAAGALLKG
jgi:inositol-phosphate phosphatase/L-galactose 1-phosphate phosphatase/histidinol-phosphatase